MEMCVSDSVPAYFNSSQVFLSSHSTWPVTTGTMTHPYPGGELPTRSQPIAIFNTLAGISARRSTFPGFGAAVLLRIPPEGQGLSMKLIELSLGGKRSLGNKENR